MAKTYNRLNIEINDEILDIVTAVQDDSFSRYLDVYLTDNGQPIDLTEHTVRIYFEKPDKTFVWNQGEITDATNGRVQFELTNQVLAVCGLIYTQITIYNKEEKEILSTRIFKIFVTKSLINCEAIESSNEFGALVVLFQNLYEAYAQLTKLLEIMGVPGATSGEIGVETAFELWEYVVNQNKELKNQIELAKNEINLNLKNEVGVQNYLDFETLEYLEEEHGSNGTYTPILNYMGRGYLAAAYVRVNVTNGSYDTAIKITLDDEVVLWSKLDGAGTSSKYNAVTGLLNAQNSRFTPGVTSIHDEPTYYDYAGFNISPGNLQINKRRDGNPLFLNLESEEVVSYIHRHLQHYNENPFVLVKTIGGKGLKFERNLKIELFFREHSRGSKNCSTTILFSKL